MLKALHRLVTALAVAVVSLGWASAGGAEPITLTLDRVVGEVESVNLTVLSNHEFIGQAEESAVRTRSAFLPQVSGRASQSRRGPNPSGNSFSASLSGSLTLFDLQQHRNLRAARQAIVVSKEDYNDAVQAVMASVASLYFEHLRDRAFERVIDSNIERADVLLNLARNQLRAGVATQIDVTRAEAELVTQQQAKLQQQTVVVSSALRIKQLLNLDLGADLVLEEFPVRRDLDEAVRNLTVDQILEARADYRASVASLEQARLQHRAAGAARVPTVDLTSSAGVNSEVILDGDERESYGAGLELSLPIFEGHRIRADQRIAASRERQQEFGVAGLRNLIGAELRNALQTVISQIAQIEVAEKNLALSTEELRLARVRYEQGVADNRELIDAENRFTQSSFNLVSALHNYYGNRVELARVRGDVRLILAERGP